MKDGYHTAAVLFGVLASIFSIFAIGLYLGYISPAQLDNIVPNYTTAGLYAALSLAVAIGAQVGSGK